MKKEKLLIFIITYKAKKRVYDVFKKINFNSDDDVNYFINNLKVIYEDLWKQQNQINTSIKLPLLIRVDNKNLNTSLKFESSLDEIDLIGSYSISKFDKNFIFYDVIFNGTPNNFIKIMTNKNFKINTQKKIWILE